MRLARLSAARRFIALLAFATLCGAPPARANDPVNFVPPAVAKARTVPLPASGARGATVARSDDAAAFVVG